MLRLRFLFCVIFFVSYGSWNSKAYFTIQNSLLTGHVFKNIFGIDWLQCVQECYQDTACFSFNFFLPGKICELNNSGLKDRCNADSILIKSPGWIYHEIDPLQVKISEFQCEYKWYSTVLIFDIRPPSLKLPYVFFFVRIARFINPIFY